MSDLGVLVLSCDRYNSLWDLFFSRWERFWPECPYPVYLLSNQINYIRPGVSTLKTGKDIDWSSNFLNALEQIPQGNLLLMIEDAPLDSMVDTKVFDRLYGRFHNERLNYLNLKSSPAPNGITDAEMGDLLPGTLYRTALVPCLWKKDILKHIVIHGETAWQFEILGADRSDHFLNFRSTRRPFFRFLHCIIRGRIDRRAWKVLQRSNELNNIDFQVMTRSEQIKLVAIEIRSNIFNLIIPDRYKKYIRKIFKKNA